MKYWLIGIKGSGMAECLAFIYNLIDEYYPIWIVFIFFVKKSIKGLNK